MTARARLPEIRTAIASTRAYMRYAGCSLDEAVDVVCDYQRMVDDRDRRIVRNALLRDQAPARRAAG